MRQEISALKRALTTIQLILPPDPPPIVGPAIGFVEALIAAIEGNDRRLTALELRLAAIEQRLNFVVMSMPAPLATVPINGGDHG